ncbi:MAG: hypothetical protein JST82_04700 [Bacteroidetes bacterium]|nr:hypothetical protein [Bacteroidota bacterium]
MQVNKKDFDVLNNAIDEWRKTGKISDAQSHELKNSIEHQKSGSIISNYFFFIALSCGLLAFAAIFIDDKFLEKLRVYFSVSNVFIAILFTALSIVGFVFIKKRRAQYSPIQFEVYSIITSLLVMIAVVYYCKEIGFGAKYSGFLSVLTILFVVLSLWLRSNSLWMIAILSFMGWYGTFSESLSTDFLFIGMNYPVRFSVFGVIIIFLSALQSKIPLLQSTQRITYISGLVILLTGLWGVSVFGNYNSMDEWLKVRQTQVVIYAIIFAIISSIIFYIGIKKNDAATRDIAVFALLLNLYTRYFEYFWNSTNKGIFFLILALSFWFVGWRIEKRRKSKMLRA